MGKGANVDVVNTEWWSVEFSAKTRTTLNCIARCLILRGPFLRGLLLRRLVLRGMGLACLVFSHPSFVAAQTISAPSIQSTSNLRTHDPRDPHLISGCPVFALESIELPAKDTGLLIEVSCQANDEVSGQTNIARLDDRSLEIERSIALLQSQVAASEANDTSDVRFAESLVEEAKIALESFEQMRSKGSVSETELRQKQLAVAQAELKLLGAKQAFEQRKLRAKISQAAVVVAEEKLKKLKIVAPFDGTVTEVHKKSGEWVQAGQPVCKIVLMDELRVDCHLMIDRVDPAKLVGLPVRVYAKRADIDEMIFSGKISSFDPEVSSLGTIKAHAVVQNKRLGNQWQLLPGMSVSLQIITDIPLGNLVREPAK